MVVVMAAEAEETEVDGVVDRVRAAGGDAFVSRGMSRTIVGLVGDVDRLDTLNLRGMPGVSDVVRISAPYKLVSREHHRERSVIRVAGDRPEPGPVAKPKPELLTHDRQPSACRQGEGGRSRSCCGTDAGRVGRSL